MHEDIGICIYMCYIGQFIDISRLLYTDIETDADIDVGSICIYISVCPSTHTFIDLFSPVFSVCMYSMTYRRRPFELFRAALGSSNGDLVNHQK